MTVKIRKARLSDAGRINKISRENWMHSFRGIYSAKRIKKAVERNSVGNSEKRFLRWQRSGSGIYVAVLGKTVVGYILYRRNPKALFIGSLYVDRKHQRKGIGTRLILFMQRKEKAKAYTVTSANKKETIKFY